MNREFNELAEAFRDELVASAQHLTRTPSPSFREERAALFVKDLLEELGYDLVFRDGAGNVVGFLAGSEEGPTVLLNSHLDTSSPEDPKWRDHPFAGSIERGRIYGYGAAHSKGGLIAQIYAGHVMEKSRSPLYGTVLFAATVAQKGGNGAGVRHLLDETLPRLGVVPDLAILGEPTSLRVCNGHDGRADVDVRVSAGDDPTLRELAELVRKALTAQCVPESGTSKFPHLRLSEPVYDNGGGARQALLRVRCRAKPGEAIANCVGAVKRLALAALEPSRQASVSVHVHSERRSFYTGKAVEFLCWNNPWQSDASDMMMRRALEALAAAGWSESVNRMRKFKNIDVGTAGSLLADSYHIPTIGFGPGDENPTQASREFVEIDELVKAVAGTAILVDGAIGTPSSLVWPTRRAPRDTGRIQRVGGDT